MPSDPAPKFPLLAWTPLLILLGFCVQLGVLIRFSQSPDFLPQHDDMAFYSDWGLRIAKGQWSDGKAFYGLPGYAYVLGAFYAVLGFDPFSVGLLQCVWFGAVAGVIYQLSLRSFSAHPRTTARAIGILAALGWIFCVPAQTFSVVLMPTVWAVLAYWACITWVVSRPAQTPLVGWALLGAAMGLVSLMVATSLMLIPLVVAAILLKTAPALPWNHRVPRSLAALALFSAGLGLGVAPAVFHNRIVAGEPVMLSAHGGINFWIGNNPAATGYPKIPPGMRASQSGLLKDSIRMAEAEAGRALTRTEVSAFWTAKAHAYIGTHFGDWLRLMTRKFHNFWNAYSYDDIATIQLLRTLGVTWPGLNFGIIAALGLAGLLGCCWKESAPRWIAVGVGLHLAALMPVFITERYRLAAVPGLLIFAAWLLVKLWETLVRAQYTLAALLGGTALACAWRCSSPPSDLSLWALDRYKAGLSATQSGDLARARQQLQIAMQYSPQNADIHFAMGNVSLKAEDRSTAKFHYRHALELNPRHAGLLNNLGVIALEEKRWELAEKFLGSAIAAEAEDPKIFYLLAQARKGRRDKNGARAAVDQALQQRPDQPEFLELQRQLSAPE
jgi:tetratricopeptide (TPR) repeat protein